MNGPRLHRRRRGSSTPPRPTAVSSSQFSQQINEKSLSVHGDRPASGERAEGYIRLVDRARRTCSAYRAAAGLGARRRPARPAGPRPAGTTAGCAPTSSSAATPSTSICISAPARTTTWDPEMVIDLQVWQDLRAADREPAPERAAGRATATGNGVRRRFHGVRRLLARPRLLGAGARPADQSAQSRRGAGARGRHLLSGHTAARADRRRPSSGSMTSGSGSRCRRSGWSVRSTPGGPVGRGDVHTVRALRRTATFTS